MRAEEAVRLAEITRASPEAAQWKAQDYAAFTPEKYFQDGTGQCVLVAVAGEDVVGFVAIRIVVEELEVLNLAVAAAHRVRGVGSALLDAAFQAAKQAGATTVFCEVRESNLGAQAFYAKHKFAHAGRRLRYYANPVEDALVLGRSL